MAATPINTNRHEHVWPSRNTPVYVARGHNRLHVVARDPTGVNLVLANQSGVVVRLRMYCGVEFDGHVTLSTIQEWDQEVETARVTSGSNVLRCARVGVLHPKAYSSVHPACLDCARLFNQSEISV